MKNGEKIRKRDDKLLRNEKSWRRSRFGALILLLVWLLISYTLFESNEFPADKEGLYACIGWVLFWIVVFDWLTLRIWHIESIRYYRAQKDTD